MVVRYVTVRSDLGMLLPLCVCSLYRSSLSGAGLVASTDAITLCHLNKRNGLTHGAIPEQQKVVNEDEGERKLMEDLEVRLFVDSYKAGRGCRQIVCMCTLFDIHYTRDVGFDKAGYS